MSADQPYLGEIAILPFTFSPENWLPCEGQKLSIREYTALFSLLGDRFGGDGTNTFGVPDLRKQSKELGATYSIALNGVYPSKG